MAEGLPRGVDNSNAAGTISWRSSRQAEVSVLERRADRGREVLVPERGSATLALDLGLSHFVADETITLGTAQQSRHGDAGDSVDSRFHMTIAASGSVSTCRSAREWCSFVARTRSEEHTSELQSREN